MPLLPLFITPNLSSKSPLVAGYPWEFACDPGTLAAVKAMDKQVRRKEMTQPDTEWSIYSTMRGVSPEARISSDNPPSAAHGFAGDYDSRMSLDTVLKMVEEGLPEDQHPTFIEQTLSDKWRLLWVFEEPVVVGEFAPAFYEAFVSRLKLRTLCAGFDEGSLKAAAMWTNGGIWYRINQFPLSSKFTRGISATVAAKSGMLNRSEVPLEVVAAEVEKRWPGRWQGSFKLDSVGVRFWDETADNPGGCQVKPDGVLCFTGNVPFKRWSDLFGREWVAQQVVEKLGKAAEGFFFDGKDYWQRHPDGFWQTILASNISLHMRARGLSPEKRKGETMSEADQAIHVCQTQGRVFAAIPLVNYPPGPTIVGGRKYLNTLRMNTIQPVKGPTGDWEQDCPFIYKLQNGIFVHADAIHYWLAWLQRFYRSILHFQCLAGQAVFLCGPKNNGKTLTTELLSRLIGARAEDPTGFMITGESFNENLFATPLWAVNDQMAPSNPREAQQWSMRLKSAMVNTHHSYHAKFRSRATVTWVGRIIVTANDDPGSIAILPEVNSNTRDKLMFFLTKPFDGVFPSFEEISKILDKELPHFAYFLDEVYQPPKHVLSDTRMGVESYFAPELLHSATYSSVAAGLEEILIRWFHDDDYWREHKDWTGSPTDLKGALELTPTIARTVDREWPTAKLNRALAELARRPADRIVEHIEGPHRCYKITPNEASRH